MQRIPEVEVPPCITSRPSIVRSTRPPQSCPRSGPASAGATCRSTGAPCRTGSRGRVLRCCSCTDSGWRRAPTPLPWSGWPPSACACTRPRCPASVAPRPAAPRARFRGLRPLGRPLPRRGRHRRTRPGGRSFVRRRRGAGVRPRARRPGVATRARQLRRRRRVVPERHRPRDPAPAAVAVGCVRARRRGPHGNPGVGDRVHRGRQPAQRGTGSGRAVADRGTGRSADLRAEAEQVVDGGVPATLVWSSGDTFIPRASFESLRTALREPQVHRVAGCHGWLIGDPDGFGRAMGSVLLSTTSAAA